MMRYSPGTRHLARMNAASEQSATLIPGERAITHRHHAHRWYPVGHQLPPAYRVEARMSAYGRREVRITTPSGNTLTGYGPNDLAAIRAALNSSGTLAG
jgi:hypothetical protein